MLPPLDSMRCCRYENFRYGTRSGEGILYKEFFMAVYDYSCDLCAQLVQNELNPNRKAFGSASNSAEIYCNDLPGRLNRSFCHAVRQSLLDRIAREIGLHGEDRIKTHTLNYFLTRLFAEVPRFHRFRWLRKTMEMPPDPIVEPPSPKVCVRPCDRTVVG